MDKNFTFLNFYYFTNNQLGMSSSFPPCQMSLERQAVKWVQGDVENSFLLLLPNYYSVLVKRLFAFDGRATFQLHLYLFCLYSSSHSAHPLRNVAPG